MKTVASISFRDDRSLSVDIEELAAIEMGQPMKLSDDGQWFCEMIVRTSQGFVALQMLADDPQKFDVIRPEASGSDDLE